MGLSLMRPQDGEMQMITHQTKKCEFCGHEYIKPCADKAKAAKCGNVKKKEKK